MPTPPTKHTGPTSMAESAFAGLFKPSAPEANPTNLAGLPTAPNFPFVLIHWPQDWSVQNLGDDLGAWWVPTLSSHVFHPGIGVNRTINRKNEKPSAAYELQVTRNQRNEAQYVWPHDKRTVLEDGRSYRQEAPAQDPRTGRPGTFYTEVFAAPRAYLRPKKLKWSWDREARNRWCRLLVLRGVIRPPMREVIDAIMGTRVAERDRPKTFKDPEIRRVRTKEAKAKYEVWHGAKVPAFDAEIAGAIVNAGTAADTATATA